MNQRISLSMEQVSAVTYLAHEVERLERARKAVAPQTVRLQLPTSA